MKKFSKGQTVRIIDDDDLNNDFYYVGSFETGDGQHLAAIAGLVGDDFIYVPFDQIESVKQDKEQQLLNVMVDVGALLRTLLRESGLYDRQNAAGQQEMNEEGCCGNCEGCSCSEDECEDNSGGNHEDDEDLQ